MDEFDDAGDDLDISVEPSGRRYLMIENDGEVGTDLLTTIGASTSRGNAALIGQFGSGAPQSIALCMRKGVDCRFYTGKQGYAFEVEHRGTRRFEEDLSIRKVAMRGLGPSRAKETLGFAVGMGAIDWTDIGMALREFVSNAADASMEIRGDYEGCRLRYVDEKDIKGEAGKTRWFVEMTAEVQRWESNFNHYFMILDKDYDPSVRIMPKRDPNSGLRVYRKGVLVGEAPNYKSLFDYNLPDIRLNEARIVPVDDMRVAVADALKHAPHDIMVQWFEAVRDARDVFEVQHIATWAMQLDFGGVDPAERKERVETVGAAFKEVFSDAGILVDNDLAAAGARRKGYNPVRVRPEVKAALRTFKLPVSESVLDHFAAAGREKRELTVEQASRLREVWELLADMGMTKDRLMPQLEGFNTLMDAGAVCQAYYDMQRDVVGMSADVLSDRGITILMSAIEEFAHAITKAHDETRDLQDWAFRGMAILMLRYLAEHGDNEWK